MRGGVVEKTRKQSLFFFLKKTLSMQNNRVGEAWIAIAAGSCFRMQRSIRKTGTWWSRGFGSILSKGWGGGREGRVSTLLYFQQLSIFRRLRDFPLLGDLDLFSARTAKLPFETNAVRVNPPSLDATRALALVHLFPRNFVGLSAVSPAALFVYRRRDQESL